MRPLTLLLTAWIAVCLAGPVRAAPATNAELKEQVIATERAFAASMQRRDHAAFSAFVADDAIFFGAAAPTRGKPAIAALWKRYFDKPDAPFSWAPEEVEVLDTGNLAFSSGPVYDAGGKLVARFSSVWRQDAPGKWHIVLDHGWDVCEAKKP